MALTFLSASSNMSKLLSSAARALSDATSGLYPENMPMSASIMPDGWVVSGIILAQAYGKNQTEATPVIERDVSLLVVVLLGLFLPPL